jgi:putative hydrolase of the HAD superfamily
VLFERNKNHMLPKGILFDLDDTIIAYGVVAGPIWRNLCEEYAGRSGPFDAATLFEAIDDVRKWYWSDKRRHKVGRMDLDNTRTKLIRMAFERLGVEDLSLVHDISDAFAQRMDKQIRFFPRAEETLSALKTRRVSMALMTNGESHKQRRKVDRFRLERFFDTVLIEGEMGYGKPEEQVYIRALDELGLEAEDTWAVGDNLEWDVKGPQKMGIFGIWNDVRGVGLPEPSDVVPDRIVRNISEIIQGTT